MANVQCTSYTMYRCSSKSVPMTCLEKEKSYAVSYFKFQKGWDEFYNCKKSSPLLLTGIKIAVAFLLKKNFWKICLV